jgi:tRNA G18 (ribose-2'-O)-methylase SpoU
VNVVSEDQQDVGVGPWRGSWPVDANGRPDPRYDVSLLTEGDRRNVVDRYRYWTHEAIVADLRTRRHDFHVGVENWGHDFNIGSVIRTANAMGAAAFHIIGRRRWNRRGAMVTDRYQQEHHHPTVADLAAWASMAGPAGPAAANGEGPAGIPIIGIDNLPGSRPIETFDLPRHCLLLFGQEGPGLSAEAVAASAVVLDISQFGSTRSINAGAAAAIAMHAWVRRHVFDQPVTAPTPTPAPTPTSRARGQ